MLYRLYNIVVFKAKLVPFPNWSFREFVPRNKLQFTFSCAALTAILPVLYRAPHVRVFAPKDTPPVKVAPDKVA